MLVGLINTNHEKLLELGNKLAEMRTAKGEPASLDKQAIEILGSFFSTVTGVPSARDHRKVIEQLNVLRDETKGIEMLLEKLIYKEEEISKNTNNLKKVASIVSVILKTDIAISKVEKQLNEIYSKLHSSDSDKLSRHSISIPNLRTIIRKIENSGGREMPLFDSMNTLYFSQKLAHSWLTEETDKLVTILQIPMMDRSATYTLELVEPRLQSNAELPMIVRNEQDQSYRYLSNSDYVGCQDVLNSKFSRKDQLKYSRKIRAMQQKGVMTGPT